MPGILADPPAVGDVENPPDEVAGLDRTIAAQRATTFFISSPARLAPNFTVGFKMARATPPISAENETWTGKFKNIRRNSKNSLELNFYPWRN